MSPSQVIKLLEENFNTFDVLCDQHGATKIKTIGDRYMCFKDDAGGSDNALAVALLALDMQRATFYWSAAVIPSSEGARDLIQIRIGMYIGNACLVTHAG